MKKIIILILSLSLIYTYSAWKVDIRCREILGWSYYSIFPEPTCHVMKNIAPLEYLENTNPYIPTNVTSKDL